jgi:hypothetical protein
MASIIEYFKPILNGTFYHAFIVYQNDAGINVSVVRGGPSSHVGGSGNAGSSGDGSGPGYGSILAVTGDYYKYSQGPLGDDFFNPSDLARLPSISIKNNIPDSELRPLWDATTSQVVAAVNAEKFVYEPISQNSNSLVKTVKDALGEQAPFV